MNTKINIILLIAFFTCNISMAQTTYDEGYYIDNNNQRNEGLIKNNDWFKNPSAIVFKKSDDSEPINLTLDSVKEFSIYNQSKFIRQTVNIDRTTTGEISVSRNPVFSKETQFLRVLLEGKANLYAFLDGNLVSYFFSLDGTEIEQLIYKKYSPDGQKVLTNNYYQQQLLNTLGNGCISIKQIETVNYLKKELIDLFVKYNECNNYDFTTYERKTNKKNFNLNVRPGINISSLSTTNSSSSFYNDNYGTELSFRIGLEAEFIFPFNNNKWALIIEPTYQYFNAEYQNETFRYTIVANYKSIELPIGIRYYIFLNRNNKLFFNGSMIADFSGNSKFLINNSGEFEIDTGINFGFGLGFKHFNKLSWELRYLTNRNLFRNYMIFDSEYKTFAFVLGYTL